METRKIQMVGSGTYTVSLPKGWAESQSVTTGDTVALHEHIDGVLAVQPTDGTDIDAVASAQIESTDLEAIEHTLRAAYAAGARTVEIDHDEPLTADQRRTIKRVARERIGMSVAAESKTTATVRIMLDSEEVSVNQSLRQLSFVVGSIHHDAVKAMNSPSESTAAASRDSQVHRLSAMIERSVSRGVADLSEIDALGAGRPELFEAWTAMRELRRTHEAAQDIDAAATQLDSPVNESRREACRDIGESAWELVSEGVSVVLGDEAVGAARDAVDDLKRTRERIDQFDRRLDDAGADAAELRRVSRGLRRTVECGGDIVEVGLRRAIRRGESIPDTESEQANQ